jgi:hypothetical protein
VSGGADLGECSFCCHFSDWRNIFGCTENWLSSASLTNYNQTAQV